MFIGVMLEALSLLLKSTDSHLREKYTDLLWNAAIS